MDNVVVTPGTGTAIAADDIGGVLYQRVKLVASEDGVAANDVSAVTPLPVNIVDGGNSIIKAEDAVHSSGDKGFMLLAVRKDTAAALAGADGDYIPLIVDSLGRLHITPQMSAGDIAHDSADSGNPVKIGGKVLTSDPTPLVAGRRVNAYFDGSGRLVVIPSAKYVANDIDPVTADTVNTVRMTQYREQIVAPNMVRNQFFSDAVVPAPTDIQGSTTNWYSGYGTMATTFFSCAHVDFTAATRYISIPMFRFARGCQIGIMNNSGFSLGVKLRSRISSYNTSNVSNGWHIFDGSVAAANYLMFTTMPLHATANAAWTYVPQLQAPMDALIIELTPASDPTTGYITLSVMR